MAGPSITNLLLRSLLPADAADFIHKNALHPSSPLQKLYAQGLLAASRTVDELYPYVAPAVDATLEFLHSSPELVSFAVLLALLAATIVVLNWIRRIVAFWMALVLRLAFWGCVFAAVAVVWRRGVWETARDAVVVGGKVAGFATAVKDVWISEYKRYEEETQVQGSKYR
ncbi:hypothetical protein CTA2_8672 [Colletotrichum tanaceti]|uniref:Uncharacterized protein n=1 Tax=Colletotrichum tanaceti TaxID=1306861 RepID=A0A4U6XKL4_9PEZI|nr:hypothetical protein CTA2_8695 [Colletotrichum tanaceti]KAJ0168899.1 hypothetical protein CTA2_8672 [Colletotrichum tanaceti]TKW55647.1 hypothetical protein CTA1_12642 [Colletotrichum tanaceti]